MKKKYYTKPVKLFKDESKKWLSLSNSDLEIHHILLFLDACVWSP